LDLIKPTETPELLRLIEPLTGNVVLMSNLAKFCRFLDDKARLLPFIDLKSVAPWRDRRIILRQCIEFVPFLGASLVQHAIEFAEDPVAVVRNESVELWVALIHADREIAKEVPKLVEMKWQTRLVAAKIIAAVGMCDEFMDVAKSLSEDPVFNVRYGIALGIRFTKWLELLFSANNEPEVRHLF
jgi:hypothetical protein